VAWGFARFAARGAGGTGARSRSDGGTRKQNDGAASGPARALPWLALAAWAVLFVGTVAQSDPRLASPPGMAETALVPASRDTVAGDAPAAVTDRSALRATPLRVAAVQADVLQRDKWEPSRIDSTKVPYARLTGEAAAAGAELVVWAETALPAYLRFSPRLLDWTRDLVRETGVWLYTGFPDVEPSQDPGDVLRYNGSGLFSPQGGLVDRYAKHHLLPVGEKMPFSDLLPFVGHIDVGQAEWRAGDPPQPMNVLTAAGRFPIAGLICFEAALPDLSRQAVRRGARCLVNITNDGWFGMAAGPQQHAELARMRAVECGVPMIRSANNGISFVCDARGEYLGRLGLHERGVILADLRLGTGATPFVRHGAWPLAVLLGVWTLVAVVWARRSRANAIEED